MVLVPGIEPGRPCGPRILSLGFLPIGFDELEPSVNLVKVEKVIRSRVGFWMKNPLINPVENGYERNAEIVAKLFRADIALCVIESVNRYQVAPPPRDKKECSMNLFITKDCLVIPSLTAAIQVGNGVQKISPVQSNSHQSALKITFYSSLNCSRKSSWPRVVNIV